MAESEQKDVHFVVAEQWRLRSVVGRVTVDKTILKNEVELLLPIKVILTEIIPKTETRDYEPEVREMKLRDYKMFEFSDLEEDREYTLSVRVGSSNEDLYKFNVDARSLKAGVTTLDDIIIKRADLDLAENRSSSSSASLFIILGIIGAAGYFFTSKN